MRMSKVLTSQTQYCPRLRTLKILFYFIIMPLMIERRLFAQNIKKCFLFICWYCLGQFKLMLKLLINNRLFFTSSIKRVLRGNLTRYYAECSSLLQCYYIHSQLFIFQCGHTQLLLQLHVCLCVCVYRKNNTPDPFQPNCSSYSKLLIAQKTGPNTIPTSTVVFKKQPSSISFVEMGMLLSQLKWREDHFL